MRPKSYDLAGQSREFLAHLFIVLICLRQHLLSEGAVVRTDNNGRGKKVLFLFFLSVLFQTVILCFFFGFLFLYLLLLLFLLRSSFPIAGASFYYNDWPARSLDNEAIFFPSQMNFHPEGFEMHVLLNRVQAADSLLLKLSSLV